MNEHSNNRRVALHTLGCKLNYAETSTIGARFRREGYEITEIGSPSDVIVINSCTVTENADRECRQLVRRALRANPNAFVVVTGCYAQLQPEEIASIEGVDLVLGSSEKFRVFELGEDFMKRDVPKVLVGELDDADSFGPASSGEEDARTRAFLKVQDGCDYNCSFCTIPLARGASRSHEIDAACDQARELVSNGFQEIIITGVNVGDFGKGKEGGSLADLLRGLHDVEGLQRLRISSIEPNLLTAEIIGMAASSPIMTPHFHIPLQSGSDEILSRMRRRYRSALYRERVERIVSAMPDAAIGVDLIVGFPGESDAHFQETYEFVEDLPVAYLHVFTYSERENTPAAEYGGIVPVEVRRNRTRMLRTLSQKKRAAFALRFEGTRRGVLFEHRDHGGLIQGYSDNYLRVAAPYHPALEGTICDVEIGEFQGEYSLGSVVSMPEKGALAMRLPYLPVING